jgi:uncharacterized protein YbaR (Trm112 family)
MHIELTEMLRCPEPHREEMLVLSTGEIRDRMVFSGLVGCPVCHKEYPISRGVVNFRRSRERVAKESSGPRPAINRHRTTLRGRREAPGAPRALGTGRLRRPRGVGGAAGGASG